MKTRQGFVSNSSSSSFVIMKRRLNNKQAARLLNHIEYAVEIGEDEFGGGSDNAWEIIDQGDKFLCTTSLDNFDLKGFVIKHLCLVQKDILEEKHGHW